MNNNNLQTKPWEEDELFMGYLKYTYGSSQIPFTGKDILNFLREINPRELYVGGRKGYRISHKRILLSFTDVFCFFTDEEHSLKDVLKENSRIVVEDNGSYTIYYPDQLIFQENPSRDGTEYIPVDIIYQGRRKTYDYESLDIPIDCISHEAINRYFGKKAEKIRKHILEFGQFPTSISLIQNDEFFYIEDKSKDLVLYSLLFLKNDNISETFIYSNDITDIYD